MGVFLPADQLKQRFAEKLAGRAPEQLVSYCGSGVTACHNLFAMALAGYPLGKLYAGSWSEWINNPQHAVVTGDEAGTANENCGSYWPSTSHCGIRRSR